MKTISVRSVGVGDRQRKTIDNKRVEELAQSIESKGLFHPIVCREEDNEIKLVAGERRLRAIKFLTEKERQYSHDGTQLELGTIPYVLVGKDLDDIQVREAELEENIIRVDLKWQERVAALDELHSLRLARNPDQTVYDTARELEDKTEQSFAHNRRLVAQSRVIAGHLDDPEVANAKDLTAAYGIVAKKMERELTAELDKRGEEYVTNHKLIHGEFHSVAEALPKDFTLIIADPPYGMGANKFGDAANLPHVYEDNQVTGVKIAEQILAKGFEITKDEAHLYMFCDIENFFAIRALAGKYGWTPWRTPVIWKKTSAASHAPIHNKGFRRTYELMFFASKGDKAFAQVWNDVLEYPSPRVKDVAAQKPIELYTTIMGRSCFPGDKVLDPTCGSGTVFPAAEARKLEAYGIEKDEGAHQIATQTLNSLSPLKKKQGTDPDEW